jgi:hypothetical protein
MANSLPGTLPFCRITGSDEGAQSNDSRFFVDEVDHQIRIRATTTGLVVHELEKDTWWATFARFSPDATRLALRRYLMETGTDKDGNYWIRGSKEPNRLRLYDTKTGKTTGDIQLKNGLSWVVPVFSPVFTRWGNARLGRPRQRCPSARRCQGKTHPDAAVHPAPPQERMQPCRLVVFSRRTAHHRDDILP